MDLDGNDRYPFSVLCDAERFDAQFKCLSTAEDYAKRVSEDQAPCGVFDRRTSSNAWRAISRMVSGRVVWYIGDGNAL